MVEWEFCNGEKVIIAVHISSSCYHYRMYKLQFFYTNVEDSP